MSRTLLLLVLTLAFVCISRAFAAADDGVSCLQSSPLSIKSFRNRLRATENPRLNRIRKKICIKRTIRARVDKLGANRVKTREMPTLGGRTQFSSSLC